MTADAPLPGTSEQGAGQVVRCGMCGRPLVSREARRRRLGPECWGKTHDRLLVVRGPGRFEVEQEQLPGL